MKLFRAIICLFLLAGLFCGCSRQVADSPSKPLCVDFSDKQNFMEICEDVLQGMHFEVEKFDFERGYIKTRPLRGGQFFEVWRSDNVGSENFAKANIQSILRTVELNIYRTGKDICVKCQTSTRRLSIPEKDITSYSANAGIFTGGSVDMQKIRPKDPTQLDWIDLGPDHALENRILKRIEQKIAKLKGNN